MLNKFMKRGQRKPSKTDTDVYDQHTPTGNHSSASTTAADGDTPPPATSGALEPLPMFREVPVSERQKLFLKKCHVCRFQFDFTDTTKMAIEKEIKRLNLLELVDYVQTDSGKITESNQEEMIRMISVNIFRCLPPGPHEITGSIPLDTEEDEPYLDPSWPHLQLVYELLLRYIVSTDTDTKVAKRYIDQTFVLKLLDMFNTEDPREREYLKTILHRIYGKFMVHRPFIRRAINNIFYQFIYETERNSGIEELLEILGSIINGFALPMKEEHKLFLVRALIPLHKPKQIGFYHQQLSYCITQFIEKDNKLSDTVIMGLLKYWPVTNCQKEVLFLGELEEVLEATQGQEFKRCMVPLFRRISKCLNSPHFQVAERALFMWNSDHIVGLIAQNRTVVLPIIFQALDTNIRAHWNPAVNGLTVNVRKMLMEMDLEFFEEYQREFAEKQALVKVEESQREEKWQKLQETADMDQIG